MSWTTGFGNQFIMDRTSHNPRLLGGAMSPASGHQMGSVCGQKLAVNFDRGTPVRRKRRRLFKCSVLENTDTFRSERNGLGADSLQNWHTPRSNCGQHI